jgi:hypothetical protein
MLCFPDHNLGDGDPCSEIDLDDLISRLRTTAQSNMSPSFIPPGSVDTSSARPASWASAARKQ